VIHCRFPQLTDTGREAGRSKPKRTVPDVGEKARIAWVPGPVGPMRALSTGPTEQRKHTTENMLRAWLEELLSLITFFAAAKKVIPPPGRRLLNKKQKTSISKQKNQPQPQTQKIRNDRSDQ
jgi:hypothetical protein